jgi:protein-S-isoprenylcysteine O-methyltransferase Ste14
VSGPARQSWVRVALTPPLMGAVLFSAAGRLDWWGAWALIALVVVAQVEVIVMLQRKSPDLLIERNRIRSGTKTWDKVIVPLIAVVLPLMTWILAGLDLRYGWTVRFPALVQAAGLLMAAAFAGLTAWAMKANRFFANTVRIQTERGHCVADTGPYALVRHPGYVGMMGFTLATPLVLGSALAFYPAVLCAGVFVIRTALEDRTLRAELAGYAAYAERTRYRLIPGLW